LTAKVTAEHEDNAVRLSPGHQQLCGGVYQLFHQLADGHAHLVRSLERAGKYKDMISKDLRDQGLPQDLIYLAMAESGFHRR